MAAATETTRYENGGRGDSRIAPTRDWPGDILGGITLGRVGENKKRRLHALDDYHAGARRFHPDLLDLGVLG